MKKIKLLSIASITGLLLALAWPSAGFAPLLLIAFVPLIWVEDYIAKEKTNRFPKFSVFTYSFVAFFIWNIIQTYWICYSTLFGLFAPVINAILGASVFQLYHYCKRVLFDNKKGYFLLPLFWISMEYLCLFWDLSWPWMILGNGFSTTPKLVQWYEYTGVFGGSLWVFISNYFAFEIIKHITEIKASFKKFTIRCIIFLLTFILPILVSLILCYNYQEEKNKPTEVVVIQPNLEPYDESKQLDKFQIVELITNLARQKIDNNTSFILTPEGCLEERIWEDDIKSNISLQNLSKFVAQYDNVQWITGVFTRKLQSEQDKTQASRKIDGAPLPYFSVYNSAVHIKRDGIFEVYHKNKLVPGVESVPFKKYLKGVLDYIVKLGSLPVGSLGVDNQQPLFSNDNLGIKVTTSICYESVYGEFVARQVRKGAELIFIITNDSWWRDTQGHKQHASYASLRAIESRRYIARSANTGTSCFVNPKGEISQKTMFNSTDVIKASVVPMKKITFYVRYGDYIARVSSYSSILLILISIVYSQVKKRKENV